MKMSFNAQTIFSSASTRLQTAAHTGLEKIQSAGKLAANSCPERIQKIATRSLDFFKKALTFSISKFSEIFATSKKHLKAVLLATKEYLNNKKSVEEKITNLFNEEASLRKKTIKAEEKKLSEIRKQESKEKFPLKFAEDFLKMYESHYNLPKEENLTSIKQEDSQK